jgi:hypothetical protein
MQAGQGLVQLAAQLRAAAEQQGQFQQEMRLRGQDQQLRQDEFANTQKQQGVQNQQQQYGDLASALQNGWKPVAPGAPPADPSRVITPPGSTQGFYVPTQDETNAAATKQKGDEAKAVNDANSYSAPWLSQALESHMGVPTGSLTGVQLPKQALPGMLQQMFKPDPVAKTVTPHIEKDTNDNGDVTTRAFDQTAGTKLWSNTEKGIGPRRKDPDAQGNGGPKPPTNTQLNAVSNKMKVSLARAEAAFKKAMGNAKIGGYTDTEAAGQALADLHTAKQGAQDTYEQELQQYGIPTQHVEYSEEKADDTTKQGAQGTQPVTPTTPAKPAAAAPQQQQKPQQPKKEASRLPGGQKAGMQVTLKSGQKVTIKKIYADGTFEY